MDMKKTKIVCTLGPSTDVPGVIEQLAEAGMNVARLNMSHGDHDEHRRRIAQFNSMRERYPGIALLLDTQGPEIRTGIIGEGKLTLDAGQTLVLTTRKVTGGIDADTGMATVSVSYERLPMDVVPGSCILIDDGLIELRVTQVEGTEVTCTAVNGGTLGSRKGINMPGIAPALDAITPKDISDIRFGVAEGIDFVAASFTRRAQDVRDVRVLLDDAGGRDVHIIAKIENQQGVENLDEILDVADGIMVARGDLGVEIPLEEVPMVQKSIVAKCVLVGKPVIIATQMLESMVQSPRPTRAETNDIANSILDGTDAIMLSGETAIGRYPVEAVRTMARVAARAEQSANYGSAPEHLTKGLTLTGAVSDAACAIARDLGANVIIIPTQSGSTAAQVSRFRPACMLIATTSKERTMRQLALTWGVTTLLCPVFSNTDELIERSIRLVRQAGYLQPGNLAIITAGIPVGFSGMTNLIKVHHA